MTNIHNLYLFDEVNYSTIQEVFQGLDEAEANQEVSKVRLTICSYGGYIFPALALYDRMKKYPKEIEVVATGTCQSAALAITQAASQRFATENTVFLIHQTVANVDETNISHLLVESEQLKKNDERLAGITISRSTINAEQFKELTAQPHYLTAKEALDYGFIDRII